MKQLSSMLALLGQNSRHDITLTDITADSRAVTPGTLFCAIKGERMEGHDFIADALVKGAVAVFCETLPLALMHHDRDRIFVLPDLYHRLGMLADFFYDKPSSKLKVIGVTGTNGKTSSTHYIAQLLYLMGEKAGIIGTLGNGVWGHLTESMHTTPDVLTLHKTLKYFVDNDVAWVVMEVSSHALEQNRVDDVRFYAALFTNLTQDHLDYHHTMEAYGAAKSRLFYKPNLKLAVLNRDDAFSKTIVKTIALKTKCYFYDSTEQVKTQLLGAFNISNVNAALTVLEACGFPRDILFQRTALLTAVKGRMESVHYCGLPLIVIDYAHTPDALTKVLHTLKATHKKVWVVFGCGGDRDKAKRPLMAKAAETLADQVIVTEDNSRFEALESIFADIKSGFSHLDKVNFIAKRTDAIHFAMKQASADDIILLAGKGHETYLDQQGKKLFYDEREVIAEFAKNHSVSR